MDINQLKQQLWVDRTPLEVSGKQMEHGSAYIFFRGDDSFMIHQPLESIGGRWHFEKWFDFYRSRLDVRTNVTCILEPVSKLENHDSITGTYLISSGTLEAIEKATYNAFNSIMPSIKEIEDNIRQYYFNKHYPDSDKVSKTFVTDDEVPLEIEPGTCLCSKNESGYIRLYKVKTMDKWQIGEVHAYNAEEYSIILGEDMCLAHMLNGRFVSLNTKGLPEECKDEAAFKLEEYVIPSRIYEDFEKRYIEAVKEIQDIRFALLQIALENHKEMYGEVANKSAEEHVYKYLRDN